MSKIFSIVIAAVIGSILIISCKKDTTVVVPVNQGTIKGLVSDSAGLFNVSNENVTLSKTWSTDSIPQPIYMLNAIISHTPSKIFTLILKGPLKANSYGLGSKQAQATYQIGTATSDFYKTTSDSSVISGIVSLSTYSADTLIGTFHVTVTNSLGNKFNINGGSFNCTFIN